MLVAAFMLCPEVKATATNNQFFLFLKDKKKKKKDFFLPGFSKLQMLQSF